MITYKIENDLNLKEFLEVLSKSKLAERRPINEIDETKVKHFAQHKTLLDQFCNRNPKIPLYLMATPI